MANTVNIEVNEIAEQVAISVNEDTCAINVNVHEAENTVAIKVVESGTVITGGGDFQESFETVSRNLKSFNGTVQETLTGFITVYNAPEGNIIKTLVIDGDTYTTTLGGGVPNGIDLIKIVYITYDLSGLMSVTKTYS